MTNSQKLQRVLVPGFISACLLLTPKPALANMNGAHWGDGLAYLLLGALIIAIISFVNIILSLVNTTKKSAKMRVANIILALPLFISSLVLFRALPQLAIFCLCVSFFNAFIIFFSYTGKSA